MSLPLAGLYPAFLTPLDANRRLNRQVAQNLLQHLLATGMDGVYVAGTTGEGLRLALEERKALVETLMPVLPKSKRILVHVGSPNLGDAIQLANHAVEHGAHAVSSLPPQGDARTVHAYYEELARESALPLILYYFPKASPQAFTDPQQLLDICDIPNIVGVKFTDFNVYLMHKLVSRGKLVFNGYDEALASGLLMGAQGGIGSTYNVMPELYLDIYRASQQGRWEEARQAQYRANEVIDLLLTFPFFPALRAAMKTRGFDCGPMMSGEEIGSSEVQVRFQREFEQLIPVMKR